MKAYDFQREGVNWYVRATGWGLDAAIDAAIGDGYRVTPSGAVMDSANRQERSSVLPRKGNESIPDWSGRCAEHVLSRVPEEFRGPLHGYAYERGHSAGDEEVLLHLVELVEMIMPPLKQFTNRAIDNAKGNKTIRV